MARGWESKSVEAQQEEAMRQPVASRKPGREELAREEKRRMLELTRDLRRASAEAHRKMLEQAIASLDEQLAALDGRQS
jgi:hypothetical protein